ncbi:MAG TPA: Ldh family oxidoreductase [Candidatus Oscillibacter pullicola]|nr:Ldh family oxidoreductase [Candidatus Oscillibacter pullicola]
MSNTYSVPDKTLRTLITELYSKAGMPESEAAYHADGLVTASLRGMDSHGVLRTSAYLSRIQNGAINVHPHMRFVEAAQALQVLDADGASGYTAGRTGMMRAIDLARQNGLGMVLVRNSNHFGAAALYAQMAVDQGMMGFSTTNVKPGVTAPGASGNVVGNNPFAVGIPTYCDFPFMLDMALSVVAGGKLKMAIAKGEKIPLDWATDKDGIPTDDPQKGFDGYFLPVGGFKGLGMAYAIDILCGVLTGGAFQNHIRNMFKDPTEPSRTCHMFLAVDVSRLMGEEEIRRRMTEYRDYIRSIPTVSGKPLVLPGEIEAACMRERLQNGIPLLESLYAELESLAKQYQLSVRL